MEKFSQSHQEFQQKIIEILNENNIPKENQEYILNFWKFLEILDPEIYLPQIRYRNDYEQYPELNEKNGFEFYWKNKNSRFSVKIKISLNNEITWYGRSYDSGYSPDTDKNYILPLFYWIDKIRQSG